MTITQALARIDELQPNAVSSALKIAWLSELDGMLFAETLSRHEDCPLDSFPGYTTDTPGTTVLLAAEPYGPELYTRWLEYQINLANGETARAANSVTLYNAAVLAWQNAWTRAHRPLSPVRRFLY